MTSIYFKDPENITSLCDVKMEVEEIITLNGNQEIHEVYNLTIESNKTQIWWFGFPPEYKYISRTNLATERIMATSRSILGDFVITLAFSPPIDEYNFPLSVGKTWTTTCNFTRSEGNDWGWGTITANHSIEGKEIVTVKAGTFECYKIKTDYGGGLVIYNWYSPQVKNVVKSFVSQFDRSQVMELTSYRLIPKEENYELFPVFYLFIPLFVVCAFFVLFIGHSVIKHRSRPQEAEENQSIKTTTQWSCSRCGKSASFIQQYNKWYCHNCEKYL
jgi:hypothetical protein